MPKVTIAIPTRNRVGYLALSLESALKQTLQDFEIVVSDNMCVDGTAALLATIVDPRVRILRQTSSLSMVENWNACVQAATGTYFLLLSDDDLLEPEAIEEMVRAFEADPEPERVGFVYCRGRVIDALGKILRGGLRSPLQEEAPELVLAFFHGQRETWPCSVLLRRTGVMEGYSSDFLVITDAAVWMKAVIQRGRALFVDEELVSYRVHASLTATTPITIWQQENSNLAALAIEAMRKAGRANARWERQIEQAVQRLNLRIVITLPLNAKDKSRRTVFRKYLSHLPQFKTWYGLSMMFRATAVVALPVWVVGLIRRCKKGMLA